MLTRDELPRLGFASPTVMHFGLLPALTGTGEKMSSSKPETMFPLHAPADVIRERIQGAFFDPMLGVDENPVLEIAEWFVFQRGEKLHIETEYVDRTYQKVAKVQADVRSWADDGESGVDEIHPRT